MNSSAVVVALPDGRGRGAGVAAAGAAGGAGGFAVGGAGTCSKANSKRATMTHRTTQALDLPRYGWAYRLPALLRPWTLSSQLWRDAQDDGRHDLER